MNSDILNRPETSTTKEHIRFATIYARYKPAVLRLATLTLGDNDEAKDIVQAVFTTLWEQRDRIERIESLDAYLYRMTKNAVFNQLKHSAIVRNYETNYLDEPIEDPTSAADLIAFINRAIDEMPPQRRRIFRMSRFENRSYEEISECLNISVRTVQWHVSAALTNCARR